MPCSENTKLLTDISPVFTYLSKLFTFAPETTTHELATTTESFEMWSSWSECSSKECRGRGYRSRSCDIRSNNCNGKGIVYEACVNLKNCKTEVKTQIAVEKEFSCTFDTPDEKNCKYTLSQPETFKLNSFAIRDNRAPVADWPTGCNFIQLFCIQDVFSHFVRFKY